MSYVFLILEALLVVLATIIFKVLNYKTKFKDLSYWTKQAIYALVFASIAIAATEISSAIDGLNNTRDAGPIVAGFFFGAPAGIAAGIIAGLERLITGFYISTRMYTNVACSIATMLAGCLAALLRVTTKKGRKIHIVTACTLALVIEIIHMLLIYVTHTEDLQRVITIYRTVVGPMTIANFLAVLLAGLSDLLLDRYFNHQKLFVKLKDSQMSGVIQQTTLIIAVLTFAAGFISINSIQDKISLENIESILSSESKNASDKGKSLVNYQLGAYANKINKNYDSESSNFAQLFKDLNDSHDINCCEGYVIDDNGDEKRVIDGSENVKEKFPQISGDSKPKLEDIDDRGIFKEIIDIKIPSGATNFNVTDGFRYSYVDYDDKKEVIYSVAKFDYTYYALALDVSQAGDCVKAQSPFILNNQAYETGSTVLLDYGGGFIASTAGNDKRLEIKPEDIGILWDISANSGKLVKINIHNREFYVIAYMDENIGMYCYSLVESDEAELPARVSKYSSSFLFIISVGLIFLVANALIDRLVVRKMEKVGEALDQISGNNLDTKVDVRGFEEFNKLTNGINQTVDRLKGYVEDEKKRINKDLEFAKSIQHGTLPYRFPTTDNYDLSADMVTAKVVGGDFYDFLPLPNDRLFFLIADVSGKGVPAAMFMMRAEALIKSLVQSSDIPLDKAVTMANNELCANNDAQMFVTCWCAILDVKSGHVDFVNAGHNPPLIKRKNGKFAEIVEKKNFVLAAMPGIPYKKESFDLKPGDEVFLYTDGVTEATDKKQQLYGMPRLLQFMNKFKYNSSKDMINGVLHQLDEFQKGVDQADDITMLMIRYKPNKK